LPENLAPGVIPLLAELLGSLGARLVEANVLTGGGTVTIPDGDGPLDDRSLRQLEIDPIDGLPRPDDDIEARRRGPVLVVDEDRVRLVRGGADLVPSLVVGANRSAAAVHALPRAAGDDLDILRGRAVGQDHSAADRLIPNQSGDDRFRSSLLDDDAAM